ncbi:FKBP-type peptidyl-prolyl cis-trans isomerase [Cytophagaceae bacterium ABcell3]|nr:FKBP-type peptidyl-prolyl cis-trans isomerase [Cytophagaceae bacterium ABcell3]
MKIRAYLICLAFIPVSFAGFAQKKQGKVNSKKMTQQSTLSSEKDSISYSLGINIGQNLMAQGFEDINLEMLNKAFQDVYKGEDLQISQEKANEILTAYMQEQQTRKMEKNLAEGKKFLEENKKKEGVVELPSGLQYEIIKEGDGPKPKETDKVTTHYHGTLIDGSVFDSSVERGQPATFPVNGVIQGWVEALQLMPVGSKWKLYVPSDLAYGERGSGGKIGPNTTLIFEVELISIDQ